MKAQLPPGYYLELDPDIWTLRRHGGSAVAAFSARGVTRRAIEEVAWADYKPLSLGHRKIERRDTAKGRFLRPPPLPPHRPRG